MTFAATTAGSEILNTAVLIYIDSSSGETVEVESNTSRLLVSEVRRFEFNASQSASSRPGETVHFAHFLRNTGNVEDRYTLLTENGIADNRDLQNLQLVIDTNGNGLADSDEPSITEPVLLLPDETLGIVVSGVVPDDVVATDTIEIQIHAQSQDSALATQTNRDDITIAATASLAVDLSLSTSCEVDLPPGERVDVTVSAVNSAPVLPDSNEYLVDGDIRQGVLLELSIPSEMQLIRDPFLDIEAFQAIALVQEATSGDNWMRYEQWQGTSTLNRVALLIPAESLDTNELNEFSFGLTSIDLPAGQTRFDLIAGIDEDNDGDLDSTSASACVSYFVGAAATGTEIRFIETNLNLQRSNQTPNFVNDNDFIDAPVYHLTNSLSETPQVTSDDAFNLSSRRAVYVELNGNVSSELVLSSEAGVRHVSVDVSSAETRDFVKLLLRETALGSNRFRSVKPLYLEEGAVADGSWCPFDANAALDLPIDFTDTSETCVLGSQRGDVLAVSFVDPALNTDTFDTALVDPSGRVFDSITLTGITDALVSVFDGNSLAIDPISGSPIEMMTDTDGRFDLPRLSPGASYSFQVSPPESHAFPSLVSPDRFTNDNVVAASYGAEGYQSTESGLFAVFANEPPPLIDIPVDPANRETLIAAVKTASSQSVEVGDIVSYTVAVTNQSTGDMSELSVLDIPPYGFRYIPGSTSANGVVVQDPERVSIADNLVTSDGAALRFLFDELSAGETVEVVYRLQATAAAMEGDGVNTAIASAQTISGFELVAAPSRADVDVRTRGIFSDDAILFGKVYVDADCDHLQDHAEWPIAGVKLYLQDGTFVVTDEDGQYSLYGLRPGLHVIKVDPITLPDGLYLKPIDNRNVADADSRFVDLVAGDMHRADFAGFCPSENVEQVYEELRKRNESLRGSWVLEEATLFDPDGASRQLSDAQRAGADGDLSSGFVTDPQLRRIRESKKLDEDDEPLQDAAGKSGVNLSDAASELDIDPNLALSGLRSTDTTEGVARDPPGTVDKIATVGVDGRPKMGDPKEIAADITAEQAKNGTFLWPFDEFSTDGRFMAVVRSGIDPILYVDDVAVPDTQIGERIVNRREKAQVVAWYGIKLKPGSNKVEIRGKDSFGNERVLATSNFKRPAAGVRLIMRTRVDTIPADGGRSVVPIDIVINDANGYPANGVYFVSLGTTAGEFVEPDLQLSEPGTQVRIENGRGKIHIRSSDLTGPMRISARAGNMESSLNILQIASARPLVGAGFVSIGGRYTRVRTGDDTRHDIEAGFEGHARAALFLKGRVRRDLTMTLSYDSDKDEDTRLLRDINTNEYYVTAGDSSLKGYEAQSRSKLYFKLERDRHSILWGDYLTDHQSDSHDLARVQRTLTGFNGIYDDRRDRIQIFAARQSDVRTSEEIPGNGTAMLFSLSGAPIVANSEVIELLVRDEDNPGLVIEIDRLRRGVDYEIDSLTGLLRFSSVIPSVDAEFNPVSIRVSYDRTTDADSHIVAGLRWTRTFNEYIRAGVSLTDDQNPLSGYQLGGVHVTAKPTQNTDVRLSVAGQKTNIDGREGHAERLEIEHFWRGRRDHRSSMSWARSDEQFTNNDAGISSGREEWRLEHQQPIGSTTSLKATAIHSASTSDQQSIGNASLGLIRRLNQWSLNAGTRFIWSEDPTGRESFHTLFAGAERRFILKNGKPLSLSAEYERDVVDANRFRLTLGSRVQAHDHVSLYANYEFERGISRQSLAGAGSGSRRLVVGVESDVLPATEIYSEYRMRSAFSSSNIEAATGVRGRYEIVPGLNFSPSFEYIDVLDGETNSDSIALSLGLSDTRNPNRKLTGQAEVRDTDSNRFYGFRATLAQRLNIDWTTLVREEFTRQTPEIGEFTSRHRFTLGLARRPKLDNQHHGLYYASWTENYGPEDGQDSRAYILSTHQNRTVNEKVTVSGRLGAKWQTTRFGTGDINSELALLDLRTTIDLARRWEIDLRGGVLSIGDGGGQRYSIGAGFSWIVDRNVRLGFTYNLKGFREEDLDEQGFNAEGLHIGLDLKFDEDWFQWLSD